jgi:hypothetical protein
MITETLKLKITEAIELALKIKDETKNIYRLIFLSETKVMIKAIFQSIESMVRAVIYFLILIIGLSFAALGAYVSFFLAIRIGGFLYQLLLRRPWL